MRSIATPSIAVLAAVVATHAAVAAPVHPSTSTAGVTVRVAPRIVDTGHGLATTFAPEATITLPRDAVPPAPSFLGQAFVKNAAGRFVARRLQRATRAAAADTTYPSPVDAYLQDGSETALTISGFDPSNVLCAYNEGWDFDPDVPMSTAAAQSPWQSDVFPNGSGVYAGYPFSPWAGAGNTPGEFFTSLIRHDLYPSDNTHAVLAHSTDGGHTFNPFYEVPRTVLQDRAMFDVDRSVTRGGTAGSHDGQVYLCFDDWGLGGGTYTGSWLEVLSAGGSLVSEIQLSGTSTPAYQGAQFMPVAGTSDGQLFLVSSSTTNGGATANATFHEIDNGGSTLSLGKSTLSWAPAGQQLGASTHWGVDGHRIDEHGSLDIDRSHGPRRGYLYFVSNRNPNPSDPSHDQGDLYLSVSFTRGASWQTARIPTHDGYTQYFPMLDVDDQGWIHLAYYENTAGIVDNGALNADRADVWYTVSRDGGTTWAPAVQVNLDGDALNYEDPPIELGSADYYLLGDYMQMQAVGTGSATAAYVAWTGYNQYRSDDGVGSKKQRVYVTKILAPQAPAWTPLLGAILAALLGLAGIRTLRRRQPVRARVPAPKSGR